MNRERERKKTELKCEWWNRLRIPFTFNFFIKKEIILFLCFYGLMVKRFNKDESKRASEFRVEARMGGAHCLSPCAKKLLKIKFFSHSHTHTHTEQFYGTDSSFLHSFICAHSLLSLILYFRFGLVGWWWNKERNIWKQTEQNPVKNRAQHKVGTINFDYVFGFSHFDATMQVVWHRGVKERESERDPSARQPTSLASSEILITKKMNTRKILLFIRSHIQLILSEGIKQ